MNSDSEFKTIKTCGLIIGSFKPFTKGHYFLIEKAASENELVLLTISQKDRIRKGEYPVTWSKMSKIWLDYIFKILPENVLFASNDNPIICMYNFLKDIDNDYNRPFCVYNFYMDIFDKKKYCYQEHEIERKFPNLYKNNEINIITFDRKSNMDVSGTKMRKTLQNNDLQEFTNCLPNKLQDKAQEIFNLLI